MGWAHRAAVPERLRCRGPGAMLTFESSQEEPISPFPGINHGLAKPIKAVSSQERGSGYVSPRTILELRKSEKEKKKKEKH